MGVDFDVPEDCKSHATPRDLHAVAPARSACGSGDVRGYLSAAAMTASLRITSVSSALRAENSGEVFSV